MFVFYKINTFIFAPRLKIDLNTLNFEVFEARKKYEYELCDSNFSNIYFEMFI